MYTHTYVDTLLMVYAYKVTLNASLHALCIYVCVHICFSTNGARRLYSIWLKTFAVYFEELVQTLNHFVFFISEFCAIAMHLSLTS